MERHIVAMGGDAGDGLGFLPGSACPHYDGKELRRPTYHRLTAEGFPAGEVAETAIEARYLG